MSCENKIYYQYHPPFVTKESIVEDMKALPPNKGYDNKYYIGFFEEDSLSANMDLILGYPTDEIAFIGLFMTNVYHQNKGVGSNIIQDVRNYLKQLGYKKGRIGVGKKIHKVTLFSKRMVFISFQQKSTMLWNSHYKLEGLFRLKWIADVSVL